MEIAQKMHSRIKKNGEYFIFASIKLVLLFWKSKTDRRKGSGTKGRKCGGNVYNIQLNYISVDNRNDYHHHGDKKENYD